MNKFLIPAVIALVISGIVGAVVVGSIPTATDQSNLGGISERDISAVSLKVGSTGSRLSKVLTGTCNLAASAANTPFLATSTALLTCSATGVVSGDKVFVTLPYTSATSTIFNGGIVVRGANVSASNVISVNLVNLTGGATSSYSWATSSAQWWAVR